MKILTIYEPQATITVVMVEIITACRVTRRHRLRLSSTISDRMESITNDVIYNDTIPSGLRLNI